MLKLIVCMCIFFTLTESYPWQILPPLPGYVPVYIRNGDTPLEDINPELAEAFGVVLSGRSASIKNEITAEKDDSNYINLTSPEDSKQVSEKAKSFKSPKAVSDPPKSGKKTKLYSFGTEMDDKDSYIQKIPKTVSSA